MKPKLKLGIKFDGTTVRLDRRSSRVAISDHEGHVCRTGTVILPGGKLPVAGQSTKPKLPATGHPHEDKDCCRDGIVVLPGYGRQEYPLPPVDDVVRACAERIARAASRAQRPEGESAGRTDSILAVLGSAAATASQGSGGEKDPEEGKINPSVKDHTGSSAIFAAAEGIRVEFHNGRFDAIVAEKFDHLSGAVNWARKNMALKYQRAVQSLFEHLEQLKTLYRQAIPRVIGALRAQYPEASKEQVFQAAIELLDEQLVQILFVFRIYGDAFAQLRDGTYDELRAVVLLVEQAFHLFRTGDIKGACDEDCQQRMKSTAFGTEDVFVARFSGNGPATIPGTRGPVGAHAIEVPHDEKSIIAIMLALYAHEFRHDIFHDVEGLAEEVTTVVAEAVQRAYADSRLKFSKEHVNLGRQKVRTVDLVTRFLVDALGEIDADISGGVLMTGPAFLYNMLITFSAFNAKAAGGVFNQEQLLRTESYYQVDDQGNLTFAVHPPDYLRAYIVASALDRIGFSAHADECRKIADQLVGGELPGYITWVDLEGQRKMTIKLAFADLIAVAPVVADSIISTPLKSLGGVSTNQLVNWTTRRQEKADHLVTLLMQDSSRLPAGNGDIYATYVAAAATLAYYQLVKTGTHPEKAKRQVQSRALQMLEAVRVLMDHPEPVVPPAPSDPHPTQSETHAVQASQPAKPAGSPAETGAAG